MKQQPSVGRTRNTMDSAQDQPKATADEPPVYVARVVTTEAGTDSEPQADQRAVSTFDRRYCL